MSRGSFPRSVPIKGFSRGIPIIGEDKPAAQPEGLYYYHVPVLVQRPGKQVEASSFEAHFPQQLDGMNFLGITRRYEAEVHGPKAPTLMQRMLRALRLQREPARTVVVPLAPYFLGFVAKQAEPASEPAESNESTPA